MRKFFSDMFWGCVGLVTIFLLGPEGYDNNFPENDFKTWD